LRPTNEEREASFQKLFTAAMAGGHGADVLQERAKAAGVPRHFASVNIFALQGPGLYSSMIETLLSAYSPIGEVASRPGPIIALVGCRGTGKTHAACGLVNLFNGRGDFSRSLYRRLFDVFAEIKGTFRRSPDKSQAEIIIDLEDAPLLVIDEVQVRSESQWENDIITNLIDRRYGERRPTVLISNLSPDALVASLGESIESRMVECGQVVRAEWPSFRG